MQTWDGSSENNFAPTTGRYGMNIFQTTQLDCLAVLDGFDNLPRHQVRVLTASMGTTRP